MEKILTYVTAALGALKDVRVWLLGTIAFLVVFALLQNPPMPEPQRPVSQAFIQSPFLYTFNVDGILHESASVNESRSPYWWLDSGGKLIIREGAGETLQGELSTKDPWYEEYARTNPADTENGLHPQNLFRLVSRSEWDNVRMEASFYIAKDNLSDSDNRNESNGLLLMLRYRDEGQTLYYAGLRVDGTAVIKKKFHGTYYTMAQKAVFSGTYDRNDRPNLLPHTQWIRVRGEVRTAENGTVKISFFMRISDSGEWIPVVSTTDKLQFEKTKPITGASPAGIRTDFMDVLFDDVLLEKL